MIEKREALLNRKPVPARQPRIGIITSNFHLCRAGMIAKKQNYGTVYGIASEADKVLLPHFSLRDGIGLIKRPPDGKPVIYKI